MLDLRNMTADQAIDAMITVADLSVAAKDLRPGDAIVYYRAGVYHSTEVESVTPARNFHDGLTITTTSGDSWSCAKANRGQLRVSA